ncbi:MAG: hypothetical protein Fur0010_26840 [Bdellovibrio sp.]
MNFEISYIYLLFSGLGLFYFGLKVFSNRQQQLLSNWMHQLMVGVTDGMLAGFHRGAIFSFLSGSSNHAASTFIGLVNAGLLSQKNSLKLICGAIFAGPLLALTLALIPHFLGPMLMTLGMIPFLLNLPNRMKLIGGMGFGIGMMIWGLALMGMSFAQIDPNAVFPQSFWTQVLIGLIVGWPFGRWMKTNLVGMSLILAIGDVTRIPVILLMAFNFSLILGLSFQSKKMVKIANVSAQRASNFVLLFSLLTGLFSILVGILTYKNPSWIQALELPYFAPSFQEAVIVFIPYHLTATIFVPLSELISRFLESWPKDDGHREEPELEVLGESSEMVPALAILQARLHVSKLRNIVEKIFSLVKTYIESKELDARDLAQIKELERVSDNMRAELEDFLSQLIENPLSSLEAKQIRLFTTIADQLEDIADLIDKMATYNTRYRPMESLEEVHRSEFLDFFLEVQQFFNQITANLDLRQTGLEEEIVSSRALSLKAQAEGMRELHLERMAKTSYPPLILMTYSDLVVCLRKIRGHTLKIHNAMTALGKD